MKYVNLPDDMIRPLPFYLAMEEYIARNTDMPDEMFFMWQVRPTVIFGRNQVMEREVNMEFCRSRGIEVYRRKSGGGCVYADMDNVMFSYVSRCESPVAVTFSRYTSMVADMLRSLGLRAENTSRNDVLIDGRKVSGNAFYHIPGRSIVHGTMLFDTDVEVMTKAITPSRIKLDGRGVESVRSRVTTLREYFPDMDIEEFKAYARGYLCDGAVHLSASDVERIADLERGYHDDSWIAGRRSGGCAVKRIERRIEGVGCFSVAVATDSSHRISDVDITGDYLLTGDMDSLLVDRLKGVEYTPESVRGAMSDITIGNVVYGMTDEQLINILF